MRHPSRAADRSIYDRVGRYAMAVNAGALAAPLIWNDRARLGMSVRLSRRRRRDGDRAWLLFAWRALPLVRGRSPIIRSADEDS